MNENKNVNLIAIKSLIEYIDNRDIAEGGVVLDDDNAEFVADILRYHYELLASKNKMEAVAQLFGKKLCEEFTVSVPRHYEYGGLKDKVIVKGWFGNRGFQSEQIDIADSYIFAELLEGEAVIIDD